MALLAIEMSLAIALANKSIEEARDTISQCKQNLLFMELWYKLGKAEKDLDSYIGEAKNIETLIKERLKIAKNNNNKKEKE